MQEHTLVRTAFSFLSLSWSLQQFSTVWKPSSLKVKVFFCTWDGFGLKSQMFFFLRKKKKDLNIRVISQSSLQPSCYGKLTPQWNVGTGNYNLWRQRKPDATFNWIDFHSECKYYIYPQFLPDGLSQFQCGFVSWVIHHFALHDL